MCSSSRKARRRSPLDLKGRRRDTPQGPHEFDTMLYPQYLDYPTGKVGILVMGNFEKELLGLLGGQPSDAQIASAKRLVRALKILLPSLRTLGGHKDFKVKTECPGNRLYPLLDGIRKDTGLAAPI